jgi:hypothetical protein
MLRALSAPAIALALLAAGCESETTTTQTAAQVAIAAPSVEAPSGAYEALVLDAVSALGADRVRAVRLGKPPEGFNGELWAYVTVAVDEEGQSRLEPNWQADSLAGQLRADARAAGLTEPSGVSLIAELPDGTTETPAELVLGEDVADPDAAPTPREDVEAAAETLDLPIDTLEFQGDDQALVVRVRFDGEPEAALERWEEIVAALAGEPGTRWLVEVVDAEGTAIRGTGDIPSAGGRLGWIRPGLR